MIYGKKTSIMKTATARFVFDRKHTATRSNFKGDKKKGLVQMEVAFAKKRKWYTTGVKVYSDQWSDTKRVCNRNDMMDLNSRLDAMMSVFNKYQTMCVSANTDFSFEVFDNMLRQSENAEMTYIDFAADRIEKRGDITEGTRRFHRTFVLSLREFGRISRFSDLTRANIQLYDDFLHSKGYTQLTVYNYHKRNKIYIHEAMKFGYLDSDPYKSVRIQRGKPKPRKYLTDDEMSKVASCQISSAPIDRCRDLFMFQCYTGMSYSDLAKFDFANDILQRDGKSIILDRRKKTDEDYYIVLLSPAIAILQKYGYKLPLISNVRYNYYLKVVAQFAKIDKPLTTHMARHTFAVFALNHGISIEVLAKMMGHTDIKTTQIYAKILDTSVEAGFDVLEKSLNKPVGKSDKNK